MEEMEEKPGYVSWELPTDATEGTCTLETTPGLREMADEETSTVKATWAIWADSAEETSSTQDVPMTPVRKRSGRRGAAARTLSNTPTAQGEEEEEEDEEPVLQEENRERGSWVGAWAYVWSGLGACLGPEMSWLWLGGAVRWGPAWVVALSAEMLAAGLPLVLAEAALGQLSSLGPLQVLRRATPVFEGLGIAMTFGALLVSIHRALTSSQFLFLALLAIDSPWIRCSDPVKELRPRNTLLCVNANMRKACEPHFLAKGVCYDEKALFRVLIDLVHCVKEPDKHGSECAVRFNFFFNATTPYQLFNMHTNASRICKEVLIEERRPCSRSLDSRTRRPFVDWGRRLSRLQRALHSRPAAQIYHRPQHLG